jgi:hypothetical protein
MSQLHEFMRNSAPNNICAVLRVRSETAGPQGGW